MIERFLAGYGLPVTDLSTLGIGPTATDPHTNAHGPGGVCGAALLVSAAGGAAMIDAPVGAPSPAPAVPDVAVVVYEHAESPTRLITQSDRDLPDWRLGEWVPSWSSDDHAAAVETVRAAIARGDVYQVNVVGHWAAPYEGDPRAALGRLAGLPGASYAGVLAGDGWAVGCASPERLVAVAGGRVDTRPIKGTRPATAAGRTDLLASPKERAEHVMIVDLERNDLARVARTGSVRVEELFAIRRWCDLWQAESVVAADLAPGVGLAELLRAVCPGGSVTGTPKRAALAAIAALEPVGRGPAMGALGYLTAQRLDLGLTIRTVAVEAGTAHLWAGGGITWSSNPADEVAEAAAKAAPLRTALTPMPAP